MKKGGKREGAGRKSAPPTKAIFIRVPLVDHTELDKRCRELVRLFYNNA